MKVRIASSPDSWGVFSADDPGQPPWSRFLDESAKAGYEGIELGPDGYLPADADILRRELDSRGTEGHRRQRRRHAARPRAGWPEIEEIVARRSALLGELGARYIVLIGAVHTDPFTGEQLLDRRLDADGWARTVEISHRTAEISNAGMASSSPTTLTLRRPHRVRAPDRGVPGEDGPRARLTLPGYRPPHIHGRRACVSFMRKHHERIPYFHLKTVDAEKMRKVNAESIPIGKATAMGAFCEPADGVVDFSALRRPAGRDRL